MQSVKLSMTQFNSAVSAFQKVSQSDMTALSDQLQLIYNSHTTHLNAQSPQCICARFGELDGCVSAAAVDDAHCARAATALGNLRSQDAKAEEQ